MIPEIDTLSLTFDNGPDPDVTIYYSSNATMAMMKILSMKNFTGFQWFNSIRAL